MKNEQTQVGSFCNNTITSSHYQQSDTSFTFLKKPLFGVYFSVSIHFGCQWRFSL